MVICDKTLHVEEGHAGSPDLRVTAYGRAWLGIASKERSVLWALLTRKVRVRGPLRLLRAFGRCFPG